MPTVSSVFWARYSARIRKRIAVNLAERFSGASVMTKHGATVMTANRGVPLPQVNRSEAYGHEFRAQLGFISTTESQEQQDSQACMDVPHALSNLWMARRRSPGAQG